MRRCVVVAAVLLGACSSASGCGARPAPRDVEATSRADDGGPREAAPVADETAPPTDAAPAAMPPRSITVAVIADINSSYGSTTYTPPVHAAVRRIIELRPDLVIALGDVIAGQRAGVDSTAMWAGFRRDVADPLAAAGIPLAVTPGNHDASGYAEYAGERAIFVEEWSRRRPALDFVDGERFPLRYSFALGPALFVSLDATETGDMTAEQLAWLRGQLEAGASRPVTIVFGHLPIHPVAVGREGDWLGGPALESLLASHGADLYLSGHDHAYYPFRAGSLRQIAIGSLAGSRPLIGTDAPSPRTLVILQIDVGGEVDVAAYTGERFDEPLDVASLPLQIGAGVDVLRRDDGR
jgi:hypothetical protein